MEFNMDLTKVFNNPDEILLSDDGANDRMLHR